MSEPTTLTTAGSNQLHSLAVRITEDLRAQLDIIPQLTGRSAIEEIRLALEFWIEKTKSEPKLSVRLRQGVTPSRRSSAAVMSRQAMLAPQLLAAEHVEPRLLASRPRAHSSGLRRKPSE